MLAAFCVADVTESQVMNAIKQVRRFLLDHPDSRSAPALARLAEALASESDYPLRELYELDADAFDLAIELMRDWRLDRYYAARIKLFDVVLASGPVRSQDRAGAEVEREAEAAVG